MASCLLHHNMSISNNILNNSIAIIYVSMIQSCRKKNNKGIGNLRKEKIESWGKAKGLNVKVYGKKTMHNLIKYV